MITEHEDYVSFETAKLLKDKGFSLPSTNFEDWVFCMYDENGDIQWGCYHPDYYCRVTLQMAMKWLREVHHIHIGINPISGKGYNATIYDVEDFDDYGIIFDTESFFHVEETCEVAIKYCLENLI